MRSNIYFLKSNYSFLLILTFLLYFFKNIFWPLTYIFIPSYIILVILFLVFSKGKFFIFKFIKAFWLPIILLFIYIFIYLVDGSYKNTVLLRSLLRLFALFSLFYIGFWVYYKRLIKVSLYKISQSVVLFSVGLSLLNFLKTLFQKILPVEFLQKTYISDSFTIADDRNFFILIILISTIVINYHFISRNFPRIFSRKINVIMNYLFIITIFLSASRRGIISFFILLFIFLFIIFYNYSIKYLYYKLKVYFLVLIVGIFFILFLVRFLPEDRITDNVHRYSSIFGINDRNYIEHILWEHEPKYMPKDSFLIDNTIFLDSANWIFPDSKSLSYEVISTEFGLGYNFHTTKEYNGFLMKYTGPKLLYFANHTYEITYKIKIIDEIDPTIIGWRDVPDWENIEGYGVRYLPKKKIKLQDGWYECKAFYTFNENYIGLKDILFLNGKESKFIITDFTIKDCDFNNELPKYVFQVKWEKDLKNWMNEKSHPIYNDSSLINNGDFSLGFKYWNYTANKVTVSIVNVDNKRCAHIKRKNGDGLYWSLLYYGRCIKFKKDNTYKLSFLFKPIKPKGEIPFSVGFYLNEGNGYITNLEKKIENLPDGWFKISVIYKFLNNQRHIGFPINKQIPNSEFLITNVKLINLTSDQILSNDKNDKEINNDNFFSPRIKRWLYAQELWDTNYDWHHKLFGHGFDYFEWYGEKFYPEQDRYDWPHNPFITVLLYSGIIGLLLYILFLIKVTLLYIKHRKKYSIVFIGFILTFFFSFFSANHPFNPPIMGFFVLIPFLIDYVETKKIKKIKK